MSDPTRIGEIFLDFNPGETAQEDDERHRQAARIAAAAHIEDALADRQAVSEVADIEPSIRQERMQQLSQELLELYARQQQLKGNG